MDCTESWEFGDSQYVAGWNDGHRCTSCRHVYMAGEIEWCGLSDKIRSFYNHTHCGHFIRHPFHPHPRVVILLFNHYINFIANPGSRSLAGIAGSNPAGGRGWSVLCCQVDISATSWSLVKRSRTDCGVCECNREASTVRRSCPTGGCSTMEKKLWFYCNRHPLQQVIPRDCRGS